MSSKGRNKQYSPDPKGRAYTDPKLALAATSWLAEHYEAPKIVFEPSAGRGAFVAAARKTWAVATIHATEPYVENDMLLSEAGADCTGFLKLEDQIAYLGQFDLILGNPSYELAEKHVKALLPHAKVLAFLLRLNWLGSKKRAPLFKTNPPNYVLPIVPRPSFVRIMIDKMTGEEVEFSGGSDATEYALFVWGPNSESKLDWLNW